MQNIPKPPVSARPALSPVPARNTAAASIKSPDGVTSPPANGVQAREKVLEAIAPMRRGRPSSPTRGRRPTEDAFNLLDSVEGGPWKSRPAKAHKSGLAAVSTAKSPPPIRPAEASLDDAWKVHDTKNEKPQTTGTVNGFADSFATRAPSAPSSTPSPVPVSVPRPAPVRAPSSLKPPSGDAFESLSMFPSPRTQTLTLGEAQKAVSTRPSPSPQLSSRRISPSPSFQSPSPMVPDYPATKREPSPLLTSKVSDQAVSAEQRFPSLEELDAGNFGSAGTASSAMSVPSSVPAPSQIPPQLPPRPAARQDSSSLYPASVAGAMRTGAKATPSAFLRYDGVRSQQVTGTAMRDARRNQISSALPATSSLHGSTQERSSVRQSRIETGTHEKLQTPSRPMLTRKHRSSLSVKQAQRTGSEPPSPKKPVAGLPVTSGPPKDWLTGLSDNEGGTKLDHAAVLRASPEKRASVLVSEGPPDIARAASFRETAPSPVKRKPVPAERSEPFSTSGLEEKEAKEASNYRFNGPVAVASLIPHSPKSSSSSDEADEGPEDAVNTFKPLKEPAKNPVQQRFGHKARQGSVHDLVDLWGGSSSPKPSPSRQNKRESVLPSQTGNNGYVERTKSPSPLLVSNKSSTDLRIGGRTSPTKSAFSVSRKPSVVSRQQKPPSPVKQSPSPMKTRQSPSVSSTSRTRPQSVLFPVQKSVSENPSTPSKTSLSPPANKTRTTHRRSSISDLVSRYEAIDEQSKGPKLGLSSVPTPAAKPARLHVASPPSQPSTDHSISPTATRARFPRISPTGSPRETPKSGFPTKLDLPAALDEPTSKHDMSSRPASRAPSPSPYRPSTILPSETRLEAPRAERKPFNSTLEVLLAKDGSETNETGRRSPSPERPYQGVSKLIDQWQRKSEESTGPRAGASSSIRGAGSRIRREAIVAGGKTG